jgi:SAM-dependent methyltransferase
VPHEPHCFDPAHFAVLAQAEEQSFWFRARNRLVVSMVRQHFADASDYLELGCGTGFVLAALREHFPNLRVVGTELYADGQAYARERLPDVEFVALDARAMRYSGCFDLIGAFDVLEHIPEDELVLSNARNALRDGGGLIVLVPQHPRLWSDFDERAHHVRRYDRADLVSKVTAAGFVVERVTSFVTMLLPAMFLSRRLPAKASSSVGLTPGPLNAVFEHLLDMERRLIESGISLPAGGSLLLVARAG